MKFVSLICSSCLSVVISYGFELLMKDLDNSKYFWLITILLLALVLIFRTQCINFDYSKKEFLFSSWKKIFLGSSITIYAKMNRNKVIIGYGKVVKVSKFMGLIHLLKVEIIKWEKAAHNNLENLSCHDVHIRESTESERKKWRE